MKKFRYSEITPEKIYIRRREFVKKLGFSTGSLIIGHNMLGNAFAATNNLSSPSCSACRFTRPLPGTTMA